MFGVYIFSKNSYTIFHKFDQEQGYFRRFCCNLDDFSKEKYHYFIEKTGKLIK